MRMFNRRRVAAIMAFAAATATLGGAAAQALADDAEVEVSDVIDDIEVEALSDLVSLDDVLNDAHVLSCDQTNIISNEDEANEQENTQTNRCVINVAKVTNLANDLSIEDALEAGINVLTEGD